MPFTIILCVQIPFFIIAWWYAITCIYLSIQSGLLNNFFLVSLFVGHSVMVINTSIYYITLSYFTLMAVGLVAVIQIFIKQFLHDQMQIAKSREMITSIIRMHMNIVAPLVK